MWSDKQSGLLLLALALAVHGCASVEPAPESGIRLAKGIEFDGPDSSDLLHIDPRAGAVTLQDALGRTLARFRLQDGQLQIKSSGESSVALVAPPEEGDHGLRILDGASGEVLYSLRSEPDGDLKVQDGTKRILYEIKIRDYGLKVERADGELQAKIRIKQQKITARDAEGQTAFSTRDRVPPALVACLTLTDLPLAYRVGLGLGIVHWGEESL